MALTGSPALEPRPLGFRATLYRVGTNFCVDVPRRITTALGGAFRIAVRGSIGGHPFRSTLVPRGGGRHRLFVNGSASRALGVSEGESVAVKVEREYRKMEAGRRESKGVAHP